MVNLWERYKRRQEEKAVRDAAYKAELIRSQPGIIQARREAAQKAGVDMANARMMQEKQKFQLMQKRAMRSPEQKAQARKEYMNKVSSRLKSAGQTIAKNTGGSSFGNFALGTTTQKNKPASSFGNFALGITPKAPVKKKKKYRRVYILK